MPARRELIFSENMGRRKNKLKIVGKAQVLMYLYFTRRAAPSLGRVIAEQPRQKRQNLFGLVKKVIFKGLCGGRAGG